VCSPIPSVEPDTSAIRRWVSPPADSDGVTSTDGEDARVAAETLRRGGFGRGVGRARAGESAATHAIAQGK